MTLILIFVALGFAALFGGWALLYRNAPLEDPPFDREREPYLDDLEAVRIDAVLAEDAAAWERWVELDQRREA